MLKTAIPYVDLSGKTPVDLLRAFPDKATALIGASTYAYGWLSHVASYFLLPFMDRKSHAWLSRNRNPYLYEIETFADILDVPGVYALNTCYEWGCTSGVFRTGESVSLLRVLDWPFPALGKQVMLVRNTTKAGEYYNLTWPAMSGVFTAMAPGRFSACINQAPMRRHGRSFLGDWLKNRKIVDADQGLPPEHLLRKVFEECKTYEEAKAMLSDTRIALPVIFVLSGTGAGAGCVIERLENTAEVQELGARQQLVSANHFTSSLTTVGEGWRPREEDSEGRFKQASDILGHDLAPAHFEWLRAPIISQRTRLCAVMDAGSMRLLAQGYEGLVPATEIYNLPTESYEQKEAI
ncbi:MAG: linear amide C-N hydrolase [Rickettsiales bacterium]|nr:linear amide C-N hydrolase [Rickettsiales bacterium]